MKRIRSVLLTFAIIFLILVPVWIFLISQNLLLITKDFSYVSNLISQDNFYDVQLGDYSGAFRSDSHLTYEVIGADKNILEIKNIFDVRTPEGGLIFSVERIYGIDRKTGKHVSGEGDKTREGFLFAPKNLKEGESYTYWHVNYDEPANMIFREKTNLRGLEVYRYETDYHADQTKSLTSLEEVGDTKGINLDINLQQWVEPVTGRMVKYEDSSVAYYYDLESGERLHPWNKFSNRYSEDSITEQIRLARNEKQKVFLIRTLMPIMFGLISLSLFISAGFAKNRRRDKNE